MKLLGEMCLLSFINDCVQLFDTKSGQGTEDEQGKGKVQVEIEEATKYYNVWILNMTKYVVHLAVYFRH